MLSCDYVLHDKHTNADTHLLMYMHAYTLEYGQITGFYFVN
jgi:hypothetical protein